MFPTGKSVIKSYYKGKKNVRTVPVTNHGSNNANLKPNTIIKFTQKDYYGNDAQNFATWPKIQEQPLKSALPNWWSRTFSLVLYPFFLFGCPSHHLLQSGTLSVEDPVDTASWISGIFSVTRLPYSIVSFFFLFPTAFMNAYTIYQFGIAFDTLFITAKYNQTLLQNLYRSFQYLLLVIPLDYVWLRGYKILNMVQRWNMLCREYRGIGCLAFNFRLRIALIVALIVGVFGIRYVTRLQYSLAIPNISTKEMIEKIMETVVELGQCLLLPLYATFCYAVQFHFLVIKALIYQWIRDGVTPGLKHLNTVKVLYTQVSDSILQINGWFYMYMSAVIPAIIWETLVGSSVLFARLIMPSSIASILGMMSTLNKDDAGELKPGKSGEIKLDTDELDRSSEFRKFNLEALGIILMLGLLWWTIWQAVKTNDCARELHLWLNDFSIGGSGVDIPTVLRKLGVSVTTRNDDDKVLIVSSEKGDKLNAENISIWARTRLQDNGLDDEFLEKFKLLKAYIHVKMELEDAALLNIACIGCIKPDLSGRLTRYRVFF